MMALGLAMSLTVQAQQLSETAQISLLTCSPGEELYARYGHTAIRVLDKVNDMDIVFNYGIFDFNTDHFYWKFVRGETWYELGASPYRYFMYEYDRDNRPVYEQVLDLTAAQKELLWQRLVDNYRPENRKYLYNFVFDNCATRPYHMIAQVLGDTLSSSYEGYSGQTYRAFIRHYTGSHSWENAGINLLFGPEADRPMSNEERLFLPEELMWFLSEAKVADRPLVLNGKTAPFEISATPWYATWELGLVLYFLLVAAVSYWDRRRHKRSRWLDITMVCLYSILLLLVAFLTFFSCHPLVGFGWRLLILPLTHLCARFIYILR
ncbi:MAG: DUF4105 domain-containing protein [Paludibacteraceae bacterium]|nr:DUF4105 domain-containing protein [Paludibacteraceae bacterium]